MINIVRGHYGVADASNSFLGVLRGFFPYIPQQLEVPGGRACTGEAALKGLLVIEEFRLKAEKAAEARPSREQT
jgi:hypothetical protein